MIEFLDETIIGVFIWLLQLKHFIFLYLFGSIFFYELFNFPFIRK